MKPLAHLRILVIEDDPRMVELLRIGLVERGHAVTTAGTADDGLRLAHSFSFEAIVLDIGLPGRSGYTVAHALRERPERPAIVMLTALNQEDHVVVGLDAGADDYLTKPFSFPELIARIGSATRRTRIAQAGTCCFGPFVLDTFKRTLGCGLREIHLTHNEYVLLHTLALRRGEVVSRRDLMQAVWGTAAVSHGALDTLLNTLRDKLHADRPGLISTIRGNGYCLTEDAEMTAR